MGAEFLTTPENKNKAILLTPEKIKIIIRDQLLELRKDEAEDEIRKICEKNGIKGESKKLLQQFYRAEKKEHDRQLKESENKIENTDLLDTYRTIVTATDQPGMFSQLKEHLVSDWLEEREDSAIAFIKEICNVLEIDNEYKNLLKKFYKAEKAKYDVAQKEKERQEREDAGIHEPVDMNSVSGRNEAFHTIAQAYMKDHKVKYVAGTLRRYTDGIYPTSEEHISFMKSEIMHFAKDEFHTPLTEKYVIEVMKVLELYNTIKMEDCELDADKVILANNKIISLETFETSDFTPDKAYFSKIPVDYDPNAREPELFNRYLDTTFKGNNLSRTVLQELAGYLLCRNYDYQYIFYLLGDGGEGKGVMIKILGYLLGEENISSFSLYQLTDHHNVDYHIANMHGKYANICGDVGTKRIKNTEHLKKLSSGTDLVTGRNPYGKPFKFINFGKIIVAGNKLPKKDAFTTGDKRRDLIITFGNKIIDTEEEIKDLAKVIKDAGEMPGILNWAIEGAKRLKEQGGFTGLKSITQRGIEYDQKSSPMKYFVDDCLMEAPGEFTPNASIYNAYSEYRKLHGMPELSQEEIKNGIKYYGNQLGWHVSETQRPVTELKSIYSEETIKGLGLRPRVMKNIRLVRIPKTVDEHKVELIKFKKNKKEFKSVWLQTDELNRLVEEYKAETGITDNTIDIPSIAYLLNSAGWKMP